MTNLPRDWQWLAVGELGTSASDVVIGPFGSSLKVSDYRDAGTPLIFVRNIRSGDFRTGRRYVSSTKALELRAHEVLPGDVLVTKMGDPPGDAAVYRENEPAIVTADCIRIRPRADFLPAYVSYAMASPSVKQQIAAITRGVAQRKVSLGRFREVRLPVAPVHEQRRIVDILDDHLSRLDAAANVLRTTALRADALTRSLLTQLIPDVGGYPRTWRTATVAEAGAVDLGRQRHPDWHTGSNMQPYLRVANVFEDRIDISSVYEMHWPDATFERFRLSPGDVLLNEGQSPELLGRAAIYRGELAPIAFTNSLLRFRAGPDVLTEFALLVFRRHMHAGRFAKESRITTNIAHLSASRLKRVEFPIPPLAEQERLVSVAQQRLTSVSRLQAELARSRRRAVGLRGALLSAAFAGSLTRGAGGHAEEAVSV